MFGNPYTPGSGCIPPYLAGRANVLDEINATLEGIASGFPQRSMLLYGLRGVGKTVILNSIEEAADNRGVLYTHIEAMENNLFFSRLMSDLRKFVNSMSIVEALKQVKQKCMTLISSFSFTYDLKEQNVSLGFSPEDSVSTGIMTDDLTEVMVAVAKLAKRSDHAICICIDEMQFLSIEQMRALIAALHRINQLRLPIVLFGAGLPKVIEVAGKAASYSERIFRFIEIGKLAMSDAIEAIEEPAKKCGVEFTKEASTYIARSTDGYPYFIQEFCSSVWNHLAEGSERIQLSDVNCAEPDFLQGLDKGFFESRYKRCSPSERRFLYAMVECAPLPCEIGEVARCINKEPQQISPLRASLIAKGMIYAPQRGKIDFTVPLFDQYLRRSNQSEDEI